MSDSVRQMIKQQGMEKLKAKISKMSLSEVMLLHAKALEEAQTISEELILDEANIGRLLKQVRDSFPDKEYRSYLRRHNIPIKNARESILIYEGLRGQLE